MHDWPILSLITFLPLVGALFVFAIRGDDPVAIRNARFVALWTTGRFVFWLGIRCRGTGILADLLRLDLHALPQLIHRFGR